MNNKAATGCLLLVMASFQSCKQGSADKKVPEIAAEMCGCFDEFKKTLTPEDLEVMKAVSLASKPDEVLKGEFSKMDPAKAVSFSGKMQSVGDKKSAVYKCLEEFDKKHARETTADKKALTEKLLARLQAMNCTIGAAMVNLSLRKM